MVPIAIMIVFACLLLAGGYIGRKLNCNKMKNTPKQVFEHLISLSNDDREFVLAKMLADQDGNIFMGAKPEDGGDCNSGNCFAHTGCTSTLPNYYCACNGKDCVAVPIM